jgi:hypothetical protein
MIQTITVAGKSCVTSVTPACETTRSVYAVRIKPTAVQAQRTFINVCNDKIIEYP